MSCPVWSYAVASTDVFRYAPRQMRGTDWVCCYQEQAIVPTASAKKKGARRYSPLPAYAMRDTGVA
eukprot:1009789-Rhodomonas_salina.3